MSTTRSRIKKSGHCKGRPPAWGVVAAAGAILMMFFPTPAGAVPGTAGASLTLDANDGRTIGHCNLKIMSVDADASTADVQITTSFRPAVFLGYVQNYHVVVTCGVRSEAAVFGWASFYGVAVRDEHVTVEGPGWAPPKSTRVTIPLRDDYVLSSFVTTCKRYGDCYSDERSSS